MAEHTDQQRSIDLNCDMGESFGAYEIGSDEALMRYITSANIACGFHAGDPRVMRRTVRLCLENGVRIGAHPGLPDLQGFGRRAMALSDEEAYDLIVYQLGALQAFVQSEGGVMQHVKPHGALYHMAAQQRGIADSIARAVSRVQPNLYLVGPTGSELESAAERFGLLFAREAFIDRRYLADGSLAPRTTASSVIADPSEAADQALQLIQHGTVTAITGESVPVRADTLCLHGDSPHALDIAAAVRSALETAGINIRPLR